MKKVSAPLVSLDQHVAQQNLDLLKANFDALPTATKVKAIADSKALNQEMSDIRANNAIKRELSLKQQAALQPPVVAAKKIIPFRIIEDVRPAAGGRLFAFTQAWMEVAGLQDGKTIPKDQARKVAGDTAIAYHSKLGNFEMTKEGLTLSVKGRNFFAARIMDKKVDPKQVEGFKAILTHGKMDGDLVKNQSFIVAM